MAIGALWFDIYAVISSQDPDDPLRYFYEAYVSTSYPPGDNLHDFKFTQKKEIGVLEIIYLAPIGWHNKYVLLVGEDTNRLQRYPYKNNTKEKTIEMDHLFDQSKNEGLKPRTGTFVERSTFVAIPSTYDKVVIPDFSKESTATPRVIKVGHTEINMITMYPKRSLILIGGSK